MRYLSGAVATDRADIQTRQQPKPAVTDFGLDCCFDGLHLRNPCKYMDNYSFTDPGGMEGWVGQFGWPISDSLTTKWSSAQPQIGHKAGKFHQPKTEILTTELCSHTRETDTYGNNLSVKTCVLLPSSTDSACYRRKRCTADRWRRNKGN